MGDNIYERRKPEKGNPNSCINQPRTMNMGHVWGSLQEAKRKFN